MGKHKLPRDRLGDLRGHRAVCIYIAGINNKLVGFMDDMFFTTDGYACDVFLQKFIVKLQLVN
jgi:hypothetical protein